MWELRTNLNRICIEIPIVAFKHRLKLLIHLSEIFSNRLFERKKNHRLKNSDDDQKLYNLMNWLQENNLIIY